MGDKLELAFTSAPRVLGPPLVASATLVGIDDGLTVLELDVRITSGDEAIAVGRHQRRVVPRP